MLVTHVVDSLEPPSLANARQQVQDASIAPESFATAFGRFTALHAVEMRAPRAPQRPCHPARIAFWNAERLKYFDSSAELLGGLGADVLMLCEVDVGMARTGNRHTIAALADSLGAGYVFGAEFVELGLGDLREQRWHAGQTNSAGLPWWRLRRARRAAPPGHGPAGKLGTLVRRRLSRTPGRRPHRHARGTGDRRRAGAAGLGPLREPYRARGSPAQTRADARRDRRACAGDCRC